MVVHLLIGACLVQTWFELVSRDFCACHLSLPGHPIPVLQGALRIHGLRRKSTCYIELVTKTSTNYMITVHGALVDPFLAILSPH